MTVIIKNANLTSMAKATTAIAEWMKTHGGRQRVTVEWLGGNGFYVYSQGEKDKILINVR